MTRDGSTQPGSHRPASHRPDAKPHGRRVRLGAAGWLRRLGLLSAAGVSMAVGAAGGMQALDPQWIERMHTSSLAGLLGLVMLPGVTWLAWRAERKAAARRVARVEARARAEARAASWALRTLEAAAERSLTDSTRQTVHRATRPAALELAHQAMAETRLHLIGASESAGAAGGAGGAAIAGRRHRRSAPTAEPTAEFTAETLQDDSRIDAA